MKRTIDSLEETFRLCKSAGKFKERHPDKERAKALVRIAEKGLGFIDRAAQSIPKDSEDWTFVFRDYYEALRELLEACLLLDGIEAEHHQCKNAYLCCQHPDLEADWEFLELVRLKRNAINYRGQLLYYEDWKVLKLQFDLHLSSLKEKIEEKLEG